MTQMTAKELFDQYKTLDLKEQIKFRREIVKDDKLNNDIIVSEKTNLIETIENFTSFIDNPLVENASIEFNSDYISNNILD